MLTRPKSNDLVLLGLMFGTGMVMYLLMLIVLGQVPEEFHSHWLVTLMLNLIGYSIVFLPGFLAIRFVQTTHFMDNGPTCMQPIVKLFVYGSEETIDDAIDHEGSAKSPKTIKSDWQNTITLGICFFGLQISYLTWGVLQEKIMTKNYVDTAGNVGQFKDSQFLVFVNRILAFGIALLYVTLSRQPRHRAPLYKYSFCSFSNIMSSWCQYEALKFVSFPTQVLAKASKIIPVMVMGKIVSNRKYEFYEYIVAVLISFGMVLFLFGSQEDRKGNNSTTLSGVILLIGYMTSDSFTSNWQNELFNSYKMTSMQMMCGVNLFSCLLTSASLIQQGAFYNSLVFMSQYPVFTFDCIVLSICSAVGQLFIYYTISQFGAVVFIIIMTLRQAMAILLSCVIYQHAITISGLFGVLVVFGAMFLKIYCGQRLKKLKQSQAATGSIKT
ncbi:hypothetical protein TCAL_11645 [Tigriopus californicus]|uniref:Adenosine 3'-phospho 5'-phosphosulfate transporter 1 n=1 Tax=Tigriopus californicus TaxID=6832 RepID=A0A553PI09_TIGCA|nr:adenosine 3'-phospho 5'-phosphosulfate transporter 1-like isoform X2 [Tigriopus californicus]XP_059083948.1 adenosine 3'-phospho 5'-phosphosulfate transporter 1-like isoform X2 [Tigriopus californicus]TRY77321.1 hypothetical protein TCAL_11645 [Tigriopus californicus]|eukprot:TCALIF_11645-PA protein Name:"Similar to sll Adenosine 3'-phospho 5'-phosphosulfate transporter 1 (Drosophila melanogaster)" AED:0.07 eAED:0.08 QI:0/-1/0/1/-1/1/1/0/439